MNEVIFTSTLLTLSMSILALVSVYGVLRFLDHLSGFNFRGFINDANKEPSIAIAIYLGCRFVGACLLVGLLFS